MLEKIEVINEVDSKELDSRLRNVGLRGFPHIKIYEDADITLRSFSPQEVREKLFTPQPSVYKPILERISQIENLFSKKGIDIFSLESGIDYIAFDENREETEWTLIPPVVEVLPIRFMRKGGLDYSSLVGFELLSLMEEKGYQLNPEVIELYYPEYEEFRGTTVKVPEICDGSHRIEFGLRRKKQNILLIDAPKPGFPYYAAPKPYSCIHEEPERDEDKSDKTHVLISPGHKTLYRLFPSGGINSGTVRPTKEKFD